MIPKYVCLKEGKLNYFSLFPKTQWPAVFICTDVFTRFDFQPSRRPRCLLNCLDLFSCQIADVKYLHLSNQEAKTTPRLLVGVADSTAGQKLNNSPLLTAERRLM